MSHRGSQLRVSGPQIFSDLRQSAGLFRLAWRLPPEPQPMWALGVMGMALPVGCACFGQRVPWGAICFPLWGHSVGGCFWGQWPSHRARGAIGASGGAQRHRHTARSGCLCLGQGSPHLLPRLSGSRLCSARCSFSSTEGLEAGVDDPHMDLYADVGDYVVRCCRMLCSSDRHPSLGIGICIGCDPLDRVDVEVVNFFYATKREHNQIVLASTAKSGHSPHNTAHHTTAQRSAAQHGMAHHSTAQHTARHNTARHNAARHGTARHSTEQNRTARGERAQGGGQGTQKKLHTRYTSYTPAPAAPLQPLGARALGAPHPQPEHRTVGIGSATSPV